MVTDHCLILIFHFVIFFTKNEGISNTKQWFSVTIYIRIRKVEIQMAAAPLENKLVVSDIF